MAILSLNILIAILFVLPLSAQATPRSDERLCEEVAAVVNESVAYGTLTQQEADHISDRCYQLFT